MGFNPINLFRLKEKYPLFRKEHPDMKAFGRRLNQKALVPGTSFTIRAVTPAGEVIEKEIRLTKNDVEIVRLFVGQ